MAKSKLARFKSKRKARTNPQKAAATEMAANVGAGFAGYAATRLLSRMVYSQAVKKFPNASAHFHFAASVMGASGVYFGSKYWSKVDDYHEAASIGAGIALIQTGIQTYMPKFGWVVSDVSPEQYTKKKAVLPPADMNSLLPDDQDSLPPASAALGDFDLDALLAGDNSIEAIEVGQAPPIEEPAGFVSGGDDFGEDSLEHYNGMLQ